MNEIAGRNEFQPPPAPHIRPRHGRMITAAVGAMVLLGTGMAPPAPICGVTGYALRPGNLISESFSRRKLNFSATARKPACDAH